MQRKSFSDMNCSIARSLEEVGEWWSLLVVREMTQGAYRFDEIQKELGIARNILTARLQRLIELEIVETFPIDNERLNAVGYRLTKKGEDLYPVIVALMQWGDRWLARDGTPPTALVDNETGAPIETITVHSRNGRPLSFKEVRFAPGPGATANTHKVIEGRNKKVLGAA